MSSLLERAKAITLTIRQSEITTEQEDVAIGWLKGEVTVTQITRAVGKKNSSAVSYKLATWLKSAYAKGKISIE